MASLTHSLSPSLALWLDIHMATPQPQLSAEQTLARCVCLSAVASCLVTVEPPTPSRKHSGCCPAKKQRGRCRSRPSAILQVNKKALAWIRITWPLLKCPSVGIIGLIYWVCLRTDEHFRFHLESVGVLPGRLSAGMHVIKKKNTPKTAMRWMSSSFSIMHKHTFPPSLPPSLDSLSLSSTPSSLRQTTACSLASGRILSQHFPLPHLSVSKAADKK